jgi:putative PIN family toxin of toxin-antitoxin system
VYRVVLDPGVLIAAVLSPAGAPAELLLAWRSGSFDLLVSPRLLQELDDVLSRSKSRRYLSVVDGQRYVEVFRRAGTLVEDPPPEAGLTPDPGDDYLMALARRARAHFLVSGDQHLTALRGTTPPVLPPRQFLARLGD